MSRTTPTLVLVDCDGLASLYHPGKMVFGELAGRVRTILHQLAHEIASEEDQPAVKYASVRHAGIFVTNVSYCITLLLLPRMWRCITLETSGFRNWNELIGAIIGPVERPARRRRRFLPPIVSKQHQ